MLKKLIVAGTLSLGMLGFGGAGSASAGVDVDVGIGLGGGYGGGGRISCRQGARIVASAGFRRVRPVDCSGSEYAYRGIRRGDLFSIQVKSRNGRIRNVYRIHGGGGGYDDDDYDDGDY
jgi:hypothetical protein